MNGKEVGSMQGNGAGPVLLAMGSGVCVPSLFLAGFHANVQPLTQLNRNFQLSPWSHHCGHLGLVSRLCFHSAKLYFQHCVLISSTILKYQKLML